jgi:hypothetical protein
LSSKLAKAIMLKCLWNLGVMKDLPPPGVPIAATSKVSTIFLNGCLLFFYHTILFDLVVV